MTDHESRLRAALEAGPIDGPWIAAGPSFGAAQPQYLNEVLVDREGDEDDAMTVARCAAGMDGGMESSATIDFIAAANPEAIRSLLDEFDALRAATSMGDSAKRLSDAPAALGVGRCGGDDTKRIDFLEQWLRNSEGRGFKWDTFAFNTGCTVRKQLDELRGQRAPDAPVTQGHSHGSEQDGETQ